MFYHFRIPSKNNKKIKTKKIYLGDIALICTKLIKEKKILNWIR